MGDSPARRIATTTAAVRDGAGRRRATSGRRPSLLGALGLFLLLSGAYAFSIDIRASRGAEITGDEPFYLLTTQSLLRDGDFDLRNQYAEETYRSFFDHPDGLWQQSVPAESGAILSPHNPGLSVYLLPGFWAGGLRGAQVQLLLTSAFAFALTFVLATNVSHRPLTAWLCTACVGLAATPFVYATEIYPEMPAAALLVAALLAISRQPSVVGTAVTVVLLSGLPWLGIKYAPLAAVAGGIAWWRMTWRQRGVLAALAVPSAVAYAWAHLALFGALTPYSVGTVHAGLSTSDVLESHLSFGDRAYRLYGIFLDRRFGIGRWAPVLLVAVAGCPLLVTRRPAGLLAGAMIVIQLGMAAFVAITMMGWWFPGRTMATVVPLFALPLTLFVGRFGRPAAVVTGAAAAYSLAVTAALAQAGHAGDIVIAVDPFELGSPVYRWASPLFPQFTAWTVETYALTGLWLGFGMFAMAGLYGRALAGMAGRRRGATPRAEVAPLAKN